MSTAGEKAQSYFDRYPERKGQGPYIPKAKLISSTSSQSIGKDVKRLEKNRDQKKVDSPSCESRAYLDSIYRNKAKRDGGEMTESMKQWHSRSSGKSEPVPGKSMANRTFNRMEGAPTLKEVRSRVSHTFPVASSSMRNISPNQNVSNSPSELVKRNINVAPVAPDIKKSVVYSGNARQRTDFGQKYSDADGEENSDSSLDSVEREVRNSLRIRKPIQASSQPGQDRKTIASVSPALQATFHKPRAGSPTQLNDLEFRSKDGSILRPHLMVPSISAPSLSHKKSSPDLTFSQKNNENGFKYVERSYSDVFARQNHNGASSGQDSDTSSGLNVPIMHRSKSSADLSGGMRKAFSPLRDKKKTGALPPVPPVPSKHTQKVQTNSTYETNEAKMIRRYVYSNRLTRLLTLSRLPYAGNTVSFADVGDARGHAVVIFLGLGAVRYLIGLYDEMASALRLRLICVDRWGMGKTDDLPSEKRGVLEWSNVISEVTDQLGIRRFSVLAHSAGAPYAMATSLMHSDRLIGPVHLLAPWVSPVIENGYKWLRYIPDGVIKTAQAAEWRMQGWRLGVGARLATSSADDEQEVNSSISQDDSHDISLGDPIFDRSGISSISTPNIPQKSFDSSTSASSGANAEMLTGSSYGTSPTTNSIHTIHRSMAGRQHPSERANPIAPHALQHKSSPSRSSITSLAEHYDILNAWQAQINSEDSDQSSVAPPKTPTKDRLVPGSAMSSGLAGYSPSSNLSPHTNGLKTSPNTTTDLPTELLRASHAESGGSSHDLLVILGRSSQKPWGFAYTDIDHPVRVWYGDKDERINMSSILWMEREMRSCQVTYVKNATHSLMTNVGVVVEALESIASYH